MRLYFSRKASGFTLTEMAIVLAVVGVLAAGLWNLLSGANTQVRDESAASQQEQLITATKTFLVSAQGQAFLTANTGCGAGPANCLPNSTFALPLPASCPSGAFNSMTAAEATTWCTDLPPGFSGTTNSYGQTYLIQIMRDGTAAGQSPNTYSFMVLATGGPTPISDTSGARISSLIGGDGGFIYSADVCDTQTGAAVSVSACGAYGGWANTTTNYGFVVANYSGSIASRTYYSPQEYTFTNWLARVQLDPTYTLNTMTVPEYLGGQALVMGPYNPAIAPALPPVAPGAPGATGADLYMGTYGPTITTGGGNIDTQGGSIFLESDAVTVPPYAASTGTLNMQGGTIEMNAVNAPVNAAGFPEGGGNINLQGGQIQGTDTLGIHDVLINGSSTNTTNQNAPIQANMPCTIASYSTTLPGWVESDGVTPCWFAIQTTSLQSPGLISAFGFYANTFVYNTSDIRLKKNIHTLSDPLSDIMKLNPVTFTFKATNKDSMGLIAQEVEKVYPNLVAVGDKGMKYVGYDGLIAPLIGAVQELKKENDELRQQLNADEARQKMLEDEINQRKGN